MIVTSDPEKACFCKNHVFGYSVKTGPSLKTVYFDDLKFRYSVFASMNLEYSGIATFGCKNLVGRLPVLW